MVITKYRVLSAVAHRSIICLSLSASENNWSSSHSHITIFCTILSNCCFNKNFINHQNGKSNFIANCIQAQFYTLERVLCHLYLTPSYTNTQLFHDTLMMILKIDRFLAKIIWISTRSSYLLSNDTLSKTQSGNKKWHSCETSVIETTDTILNAIDKKKLTAVVLLDMSKAFDSASPEMLILKLQDVGTSVTLSNGFAVT